MKIRLTFVVHHFRPVLLVELSLVSMHKYLQLGLYLFHCPVIQNIKMCNLSVWTKFIGTTDTCIAVRATQWLRTGMCCAKSIAGFWGDCFCTSSEIFAPPLKIQAPPLENSQMIDQNQSLTQQLTVNFHVCYYIFMCCLGCSNKVGLKLFY